MPLTNMGALDVSGSHVVFHSSLLCTYRFIHVMDDLKVTLLSLLYDVKPGNLIYILLPSSKGFSSLCQRTIKLLN